VKIFLALPVGVRLRLELGGEGGVLLVQLPKLLPRLVQGIGSGFGLGPDSDWIRIRIGSGLRLDPDSESGQWIRIRIRNPDLDPGGQK
jgi:hypothetical protein